MLDTRTGPNLVRAYTLPQRLLAELDCSREILNLDSASKHILDVLGITPISVTIGSHTVRFPFIAVRQLETIMILGCYHVYKAVDTIHVVQYYWIAHK